MYRTGSNSVCPCGFKFMLYHNTPLTDLVGMIKNCLAAEMDIVIIQDSDSLMFNK